MTMPLNIRVKDRAVLENEVVPREAKLTKATIPNRHRPGRARIPTFGMSASDNATVTFS